MGKSRGKSRSTAKIGGRSRTKEPAISNDQMILNQLVTAEARAHGDYRIGTITKTDGEFGKDEKGENSVVRNYAVDTINRWEENGSLDMRQLAAVAIYRRAHNLALGKFSITLNWDRFLTVGGGGGYVEASAQTAIEAMEDVKRIDALLKQLPPYVFDTWQNVVLHDLAAGAAGRYLNHETKHAARVSALTIIRLCCDLIASDWGI
jgi:hypothetical protein